MAAPTTERDPRDYPCVSSPCTSPAWRPPMTPDPTALAQEAMALPGFRWSAPGLRYVYGRDYSLARRNDDDTDEDATRNGMLYLLHGVIDLTDAPTAGALLEMLAPHFSSVQATFNRGQIEIEALSVVVLPQRHIASGPTLAAALCRLAIARGRWGA